MLSSVRRLVSAELPRNTRPPLPKGPSALVLTEELRVQHPKMGHNSQRKSLEVRIAELEAAVSNSAEDWEPDGSEDQAQHRPDRVVFTRNRDQESTENERPLRLSQIALIETGPANDDAPAVADEGPVSFRHHDDTPGAEEDQTQPAEAEPLVLYPEEEPEEDIQPFEGAAETVPLQDAAGDEPASLFEADSIDQLADNLSSAVTSMVEDAVIGDDAFEASLASAVEGRAAQVSPATAEADASLLEAESDLIADEAPEMPVAETANNIAEEAAQDEAANEMAEPADSPVDLADGVAEDSAVEMTGEPQADIDEDAEYIEADELREIVSELLRDQLQGDLGERITRNVRKLVRQEIQRALAVRQID